MIYYFYPEEKLPSDTQIDNIVVYKSKRQMLVYSNGQSHDHHFKWWFANSPIRAKYMHALKGGVANSFLATPKGVNLVLYLPCNQLLVAPQYSSLSLPELYAQL
jgi:hypothetical protein